MESERLELVPPSLKYADAMYQVIDESRRELSQFLPWVSDEFTKICLKQNIKEAAHNFANFTDEFLVQYHRKRNWNVCRCNWFYCQRQECALL